MCQHAVVTGVESFVDWTSENLRCTKTDTWIGTSTFPSAFLNSCHRVARPRICCEPSVVLTVVKTGCTCRVLENFTVARTADYLEVRRIFIVFTLSTAVSYPEPWELGPQHVPLLCKFHFNIFSSLYLGLPCSLLQSCFPVKTACAFLLHGWVLWGVWTLGRHVRTLMPHLYTKR
jgi:hypothetical protein